MLFVILLPKYESTFATMALEFLTKYKEKIGLEEEEVKKIEDLLNATKIQNEQKDDESKEDNDSEVK
jgi:hypothetical protein